MKVMIYALLIPGMEVRSLVRADGAIFERLLIVSHCGVVFQSLRSFLSNLRVLEVLYLSWSFIASTSSPSTASSLSFLLYT